MAHTYTSNFIHCIFSTKERRAALPAERIADLYMPTLAASRGARGSL
jgi:hypothetical protein